MSLRSRCAHRLWQSVLLDLCAGVLRMTLLRCPKFLRCLTADAGNFDRGHSLTSLPLPLAARGSLPTGALRPRNDKGLYMGCGVRPGGSSGRPTPTHRLPIEFCRDGRPCPPGPDNATPCRAGPVCPAGVREKPPGPMWASAPTDGLQEVREKNPPVTASPCRPL